MPSESQEFDWRHRFRQADGDPTRPMPANYNIDLRWRVMKPLADADGGFNGGIDLVDKQESTRRIMAVRKRLQPRPGCEAHDCHRWENEMLILRKLNHPNIPYYIDACFTREKGSLYMQPCRLGSLADFIYKDRKQLLNTRLQEFFLWYVLHQVAQAILYLQTGFKTLAEANNARRDKMEGWVTLVHADIRPDQIFLHSTDSDTTPQVKLGDFGFGQFIKPWHEVERHDGPGGASNSKPPEFPGEISVDTDIFGLGATAQLYLRPDKKIQCGIDEVWLTQRTVVSPELAKFICKCVKARAVQRTTILQALETLEWALQAQRDQGLSLAMLSGPLFQGLYSFH